jgi:hypothetical protein
VTGDVKAFPKSDNPFVKSLNFNFGCFFAIYMNIFIIWDIYIFIIA